MTKFTQQRFSVSAPMTDAYRENWERTFAKKELEPLGIVSCTFFSRADDPMKCEHCGRPPNDALHLAEAARARALIEASSVGPRRPIELSRDELQRWHDRLVLAMSGAANQAQRAILLKSVTESVALVLQAHDKGNEHGP